MRLNRFQPFWRQAFSNDTNAYVFLALLRVILVFIQVNGYVHPDEFFQSVEVMTGDHFRLEHTRTWEFNSTKAVRSITLPFLLLRVPWSFVEFFALYLREYAGIEVLCSYTYLVFPRLIFCVISFVNDWSMYRLCRLYRLRHDIRLLALGSSWIMLVLSIRTFSNSIEMALCSFLLYLVAESMIKTNTIVYQLEYLKEKYDMAQSTVERIKIWKLKNSLPSHNYTRIFLVATVSVVGIFNRPTFVLFGAPMIFFYMLRGMGTKSVHFRDFNTRMFLFCVCTIPTTLMFLFCDSLYYQYLTLGEIQMLNVHINNFVFTPWNFIKYNLNATNTAEHGMHPRYMHALINIPILYNVIGLITLVSFGRVVVRFFRADYVDLPRTQSLVGLMSSVIFVPLFLLSLFNHQEPRFLIPITIPMLLLHAPKLTTGFCAFYPFKQHGRVLRAFYEKVLSTKASASPLLKIWFTANILLTIFFGFVHQAGVFPLAQHFESAMKSKSPGDYVHLITSHVYSTPLTFVNIPNAQSRHYRRQKEFALYEYGSLSVAELLVKVELILSYCEVKYATKQQHYRLFLAIPTAMRQSLYRTLDSSKLGYIHIEAHKIFYPHVSIEAGIDLSSMSNGIYLDSSSIVNLSDALSWSCAADRITRFGQQFGLALYEITLKRN